MTQTPLITGELPWPRLPTGLVDALGNPILSHMIADWSSAEWQNYTKTFAPGSYNVYARLSTLTASTIKLDQVTSGWGTTSQATTNLGNFTFSGNGGFEWVPLLKGGSLAVLNLTGSNTLRATTGGGATADFYMFVAANPNLPVISGVYPDGQFLFETTNKLVFTVSSSVTTISTANITVTLNGSNVSAGLVFSGGPSTWNVSYTGLQANRTYATVINVTDANGATATATLTMDTWAPLFQMEAEDFDFDPGLSPVAGTGSRFIDNAVPTPPGVHAANSYNGQVGDQLIDENNNAAPAPDAGASTSNYPPTDPSATTIVTDAARSQFTVNTLDYNVGFLGGGYWQQYTRTWPNGTFNIYGRMASGAASSGLLTPPGIFEAFDQVTAGWGTVNQLTTNVGSFNVPTTGGYSSYLYIPLIDKFGNYANVALGGTNTFRTTLNPADFGLNINFYMLTAPRTDLPRIDNVYPDGATLMQGTNTLFVANGPTYGIAATNVHVTLNGSNISASLVFSGSPNSWIVTYPGLQAGSNYTAVISVTDSINQTHSTTVSFDTFSVNNFTWEGEDFMTLTRP